MADFDLATIGDNCIDRFLPPVGLSAVGGNAVNVAVQLAHLGQPVAYFGAVGPDADGRRTIEALRANRVVTEHVRILDGGTAFTDLDRDPDGDRIIAFEEFGVCAAYHPLPSDIAVLRRMRFVHIGWLKGGERLKRELAGAGVALSKDTTVNPGAAGIDLAFASAGADIEAGRRLLSDLLRQGAKVAVVTCGALGSIASDGVTTAGTGIAPCRVVDTTGAGDTFVAGFAHAWLEGAPLLRCLENGRDLAARTCEHVGGFEQVCLPI